MDNIYDLPEIASGTLTGAIAVQTPQGLRRLPLSRLFGDAAENAIRQSFGWPTYGMIGDSEFANGNNTGVPTIAATVGALTADVTVAAHNSGEGAVIFIRGFDQPEFNGWLPITDWVSSTVVRVKLSSAATVAAGTSVNSPSGARCSFTVRRNNRNPIEVANMLAGGRMQMLYNAGLSGQRSDEILARFRADVIENPYGKVDIIFIEAGINDILQGLSVQSVMTNLVAMYKMARENNIQPVVCTLPPISNTYSGYSTTILNKFLELNERLRTLARIYRLRLWDFFKWSVNPTNATANWASNYDDSTKLHFSPYGVQQIALNYGKTRLQAWLPPIDHRACSVADTYTQDSSLKQINDYPLFQGTAGTTATAGAGSGSITLTDAVPDGYKLTWTRGGAGGSCTHTRPARSNGIGNASHVVLVATSANDAAKLEWINSLHARVAGGDIIELQGFVSLTSITALSRFNFGITYVVGSTTYFVYGLTQSTTPEWSSDMSEMLVRVPRIRIPAAGVSSLNFMCEGICSGAGGFTMDLSELTLDIINKSDINLDL